MTERSYVLQRYSLCIICEHATKRLWKRGHMIVDNYRRCIQNTRFEVILNQLEFNPNHFIYINILSFYLSFDSGSFIIFPSFIAEPSRFLIIILKYMAHSIDGEQRDCKSNSNSHTIYKTQACNVKNVNR